MSTKSYSATLPRVDNPDLPAAAINIDARFQFAVNCGVQSASSFLHAHPEITLHTHLPASLEFFIQQARKSAALLGVDWEGRDKLITDAFLAGYLGRIQQELLLMRPSNSPPLRHSKIVH